MARQNAGIGRGNKIGEPAMAEEPSRNIRLFGTEQLVPPPLMLRAGELTAEIEAGNLRHIRFGGIEMIRAISFIVRDKNWGTYDPIISDLRISEDRDSFRVVYQATAKYDSQEFRYTAEIVGHADGSLRFHGRGQAITAFVTNRTGFVVLHPIAELSGREALLVDVEGKSLHSPFPELIDPVQPMMNLRSIRHVFAPGAIVECRMEGDAYEMEDQRNWTDASYKTYVRPLARPWPYTLDAGTELDQTVTLAVSGRPQTRAGVGGAISVHIEEHIGVAPPLGMGLDADDAEAALTHADVLTAVGASHLICHFDPRRGHNRDSLQRLAKAATALGATPWLEAVVTQVEEFQAEIAALGENIGELGSPFPVVFVSPASDMKCTLPGSAWPPCPPADQLYRAARRAFPRSKLGGGMFSYFTELNRKRPPLEDLDLVGFTTSALVHAGDDRSVTEGLESLPHIARSVRAFIGDRPYVVGPSAIGMRDNPYGAAPMPNPNNIRQAMNRNDPRQRGLLGAAWSLAYFAHFAHGGAAAIALGGGVGPFGLFYDRAPYPQPWFDQHGGLFPVFHVLRGLARLKGRRLRRIEISAPREIQAVAASGDSGEEIWLANLMGEARRVSLHPRSASGRISLLDADSFAAAAESLDALDLLAKPMARFEIELDAYAVARIQLS
jgi:D-apionolactonase